MTTKEQRILDSHLQKCAGDYNNSQLKNLHELVRETYEENEEESNVDLGTMIANAILDTHLLILQDHQKQEFYGFWENAVADVRA